MGFRKLFCCLPFFSGRRNPKKRDSSQTLVNPGPGQAGSGDTVDIGIGTDTRSLNNSDSGIESEVYQNQNQTYVELMIHSYLSDLMPGIQEQHADMDVSITGVPILQDFYEAGQIRPPLLSEFLNDLGEKWLETGESGNSQMGVAHFSVTITEVHGLESLRYNWGVDEPIDSLVSRDGRSPINIGSPSPKPLSEEERAQIPNVTIGEDVVGENLVCLVCWESLKLDDMAKKLDCGHLYHCDCILPWLQLTSTCPTCRHRLSKVSTDEDDLMATIIFAGSFTFGRKTRQEVVEQLVDESH